MHTGRPQIVICEVYADCLNYAHRKQFSLETFVLHDQHRRHQIVTGPASYGGVEFTMYLLSKIF